MNTIVRIVVACFLFAIDAHAKDKATIEATVVEKVTVEDIKLGNERSKVITSSLMKRGIPFQQDEITKTKTGKTEVHFVKVDIKTAACKIYEIGNALKKQGLRLATAGEMTSVDKITSKEVQENTVLALGSVIRITEDNGVEHLFIFGLQLKNPTENVVGISFCEISSELQGTLYVSAVPLEKPAEKK